MNMGQKIIIFLSCIWISCSPKSGNVISKQSNSAAGFAWESATIYFLLTDRFYNGNKQNDAVHDAEPATLRGYQGGDVVGITKKVNEGYFNKLGVNVLWMTPLVENIEGHVNEGTGVSYGFHGYWTKDWTRIDPRFGTKEEVRQMVQSAHAKGLKVIMDVVINHTGPVTPKDPLWPNNWVRTSPQCTYNNYINTVECTLVKNLPDLLTNSTQEVEVPEIIQQKWKKEGRYEVEMASLDAFFARTGYPRLPHYYIIKWITDLILEFGIDGFRVDTVKHVEEEVWKSLKKESEYCFELAKKKYPAELPEKQTFFMLGEVYGYNAKNGLVYDFGDRQVNYYDFGFDALINFGFVWDATKPYEQLFSDYDVTRTLAGNEKCFVHYISSHDDGNPFDKKREKILEAGTKLLLTPGIAQIYYGDEIGRTLTAQAVGDAQLRSMMDWASFEENERMICLDHWQKLGVYRRNNPAVAIGKHSKLAENVYARVLQKKGKTINSVVFGIDLPKGEKKIPVAPFFKDGDSLYDDYSKTYTKVREGFVVLNNPFSIVLLSKK